jgi:hypothetical protein
MVATRTGGGVNGIGGGTTTGGGRETGPEIGGRVLGGLAGAATP